ncbi:hypothetical protein PGB90_008564 [Kerria lacca]
MNKTQFQNIRRFSLTTLQLQNYNLNVTSCGIIKSSFPDISELDRRVTIDKYIWQNVDNWKNHIAIDCAVTGQKYTYSQLRVLCENFAESLLKQGFRPGDILSVMLPNMPDYAVIVLGAIEAGLVVSPMNPIYTSYELAYQLEDNDAVVIVTLVDYVAKLNAAKKLIESKKKKLYKLRTIVVNYDSYTERPSDTLDFTEMIVESAKPLKKIQHTSVIIENTVFLPYSSGTTGLPKGVQLTHRNIISNLLQMDYPGLRHLIPATKNFQDVIPGILPFYHCYGLILILIRGLSMGCRIVTLPKFEINAFLSVLKNYRTTVLYAVPPIITILGRHPTIKKDHFSSLRFIVSGAGPITSSDGERISKFINDKVRLLQGYGLTETGPLITLSPENENNFSSIGVPICNTWIKIVKEDGRVASIGEHGEIWVKGPQFLTILLLKEITTEKIKEQAISCWRLKDDLKHFIAHVFLDQKKNEIIEFSYILNNVMKGYYKKPEMTKEVIDDGKYLHTGDLGYCDKNGKFYIVDRIKELIKVQGFQVAPAELEAILRSHPDVEEAAVVGISDEKTGEKPLAFILKNNFSNVTERELLDFVAHRVAPFKKLSGIVFTNSIPKSQSGKILRRKLKENFSSQNK